MIQGVERLKALYPLGQNLTVMFIFSGKEITAYAINKMMALLAVNKEDFIELSLEEHPDD